MSHLNLLISYEDNAIVNCKLFTHSKVFTITYELKVSDYLRGSSRYWQSQYREGQLFSSLFSASPNDFLNSFSPAENRHRPLQSHTPPASNSNRSPFQLKQNTTHMKRFLIDQIQRKRENICPFGGHQNVMVRNHCPSQLKILCRGPSFLSVWMSRGLLWVEEVRSFKKSMSSGRSYSAGFHSFWLTIPTQRIHFRDDYGKWWIIKNKKEQVASF